MIRRAIGLAALACSLHASAAPPATYTVSIVPQFSVQQLHAEWQPLLKRVGDEAGVRLELKLHSTIPAFESAFLHGEPDFIYGNPYHAVMARRAQGYIPLVRDAEPLTGILVTAAQGPVKTLQDLDGKTLAFPAPNAFGASLYMRALLIEEAKVRIEPAYVKTHGNVYRLVALREYAAGGTVNQAFDDQPADLRAQLRVLYQTPGAAPHPLAAHPRVPQAQRKRVTAAFLKLADDEAGRALLKDARMPRPVEADYARDYLPLEKLRLDKYLLIEK